MKKMIYALAFLGVMSTAQAQSKNFIDQPYIESNVKADTSVVPDRIYIKILLDEADSKNKKSTEELEKIMEQVLKKLGIDVKSDLSLTGSASDFKKYFLKGQNVVKSKTYSLLVRDAVMAGKVLAELENAGIANVEIYKVEYSDVEGLMLDLKVAAMAKAKANAQKMAGAVGQQVGKAIFIGDHNVYMPNYYSPVVKLAYRAEAASVADPIDIDFEKLKFEIVLDVKFLLE